MKFVSTTGKTYSINLRPSKNKKDDGKHKSFLQEAVSKAIGLVFVNEIVLEEFYIPIDNLYIDFFLPRLMIAIEVHGQQHYGYSSFFHKDAADFKMSQARDNKKKLWCDLNNIQYNIIRYDEKNVVDQLMSIRNSVKRSSAQ